MKCKACKKPIKKGEERRITNITTIHKTDECFNLLIKQTTELAKRVREKREKQAKTKKKKRKKLTNAKWRKKCVEIAKKIAKERDNYTCVTCNRSKAQGYQIHGSHILPESKHLRMSCVPENIMAQCARCHMDWHEHPLSNAQWFHLKFTGRYEELVAMDRKFKKEMIKPNYEEIYNQLKASK